MEKTKERHENLDYKRGRFGLALKFINGQWITSTMTNDEVFGGVVKSVRNSRRPKTCHVITYKQALQIMVYRSEGKSIEDMAFLTRCKTSTLWTAIYLMENVGEEAFPNAG